MKREVIEFKELLRVVGTVIRDIAYRRGLPPEAVSEVINEYSLIMQGKLSWKIVIHEN